MPNKVYLLTGDIGGTNSRMSLYTLRDAQPKIHRQYRNETYIPVARRQDADAFSTCIIVPFLEYCWGELGLTDTDNVEIVACVATAGIVTDNCAKLTNLDNLLIDGNALQANTTNMYLKHVKRAVVINDFVAQGYGCLTLQSSEVIHLHGPKVAPEKLVTGPKVCVGAGTGLGECYLTQTAHAGDYTCFPSEGGHVEYAPRNDEEISLFKYLSEKFASKHRISVERVVSGIGLANVYEYLATTHMQKVVPTVHAEFQAAGDEQGRVVAENAGTRGSLCEQAMHIMMSAYGCEVGSAAVKWIPTGGLFVTGGLTPKNIKYIQGPKSEFIKSYLNKGRVSKVLELIPLYAVMVEDLGVRGAHKAALMEYERQSNGSVGLQQSGGSLGSVIGPNVYVWLAATAAVSFVAGCWGGKLWK